MTNTYGQDWSGSNFGGGRLGSNSNRSPWRCQNQWRAETPRSHIGSGQFIKTIEIIEKGAGQDEKSINFALELLNKNSIMTKFVEEETIICVNVQIEVSLIL